MHRTFKQYISEQTSKGNYIAIKSPNINVKTLFDNDIPKEGKQIESDDYHCTLMYSPNTNISKQKIESVLHNYDKIKVTVVSSDTFNDNFVLLLKSDVLNEIHAKLTNIGMEHTYSQYNPHITIWAGLKTADNQNKYREIIKSKVPFDLELQGFIIEEIKD